MTWGENARACKGVNLPISHLDVLPVTGHRTDDRCAEPGLKVMPCRALPLYHQTCHDVPNRSIRARVRCCLHPLEANCNRRHSEAAESSSKQHMEWIRHAVVV